MTAIKMSGFIKAILVLLLFAVVSDTVSAQTKRRRTTRDNKEEKETYSRTLGESLNTEIKLGNLGFNGGFAISMKSNVGYKFNDRFSAGVGAKFFYNFINVPFGDDYSYFDYGGLAYGRAKIAGPVYVQAEYNYQHFDYFIQNVAYPSFGLGYLQNDGGTWSYGIELLFIADQQARDYSGQTIEYWLSFSHRF